MATSETEICNLALLRLGNAISISSLGEDSKNARLCNLIYASARDAVLRAHPWNFAVKRVELASEATTPAFEFAYQYTLPTDCLKVIRTDWEALDLATEYRIEGNKLLTDEGTASIEYIARITDVAQFDALFTDVLAQRIAAELCIPITDNASGSQSLWQIYQLKLSEARSVDGQEGTPRMVTSNDWLIARL
jgi:hypothetical protein